MKAKFFIVAFFWFSHFCLSYESNISLSIDLVTPAMTQEDPAPGKRVRQVAPEYKGKGLSPSTSHRLAKGKTYPVLVEYTATKHLSVGRRAR